MPDVAKLKKKAAELELKKQFDKALAVYVEILDSYGKGDDEADVSLYNRVGDLYLKQGNVADAVDYYEQAVDRYAEGGFFNNAIALCNKILRNSPGRATVYYRLGRISAQKGFKADAKANYLEYADRMQQAGNIDEAFRALGEFADLCPDQDDIRLMLAEQLHRKGRSPEAIEQLQILHERYVSERRDTEARATVERMKAIDPDAEPRTGSVRARHSSADLVFLDLSDAPARKERERARRATQGIQLLDTGEQDITAPAAAAPPAPEILETPELAPAVLDGVTRVAEEIERASDSVSGKGLLEGLETTSLAASAAPPAALDGLESTLLDTSSAAPPPADSLLDLDASDVGVTRGASPAPLDDLPLLADAPDSAEPLELVLPTEASAPREGATGGGAAPSPLDDIPLMDLELPHAGEATEHIDAASEATRRSGGADEATLDFDLDGDPAAEEEAAHPTAGLPLLDDEGAGIPTPPAVRRNSTLLAAQSVELLQALVEADPDDHAKRRRLAEAMLESGDREGGIRELEAAMIGFERGEDLVAAAKVADEIVLLNPGSVRHHQKRVEYAFRTNERGRLVEAYLQLAAALFGAGQVEKSRAIYQRVLDLAPDDVRAAAALATFPEPEPEPEPPPPIARSRSTVQMPRSSTPPAAPAVAAPTGDDEYVNLGDWLRDEEGPRDTRMVVEEREPSGDEAADFQDMLRKFKQGIAENVEEEDHQSHYDLGVAYKEMGLLDEAIAEFQKALRSPANRVPTYEALGQCFIEKEQWQMASTILQRALHEPGMTDDQLVGVLYLLGRCAEERGLREQAVELYQRVFVVDIQFRDIGDRLAAVEGAAR